MNQSYNYDIGIIGGGLAGLSMAILFAQKGYKTILLEKELYPFNRVCGEYISMESWPFLQSLDINHTLNDLPQINQLSLSAPNGKTFSCKLPLGGFGISRYLLDDLLQQKAKKVGAAIHCGEKVTDITSLNNETTIITDKYKYTAKLVFGAFGKRSNIDINWKRKFTLTKPTALNNYIGVKYHIKYNHPANTIALHNFHNGYAGMSKVENDVSCLCYLTTAKNLQSSNGNIKQMEENILCRNPRLSEIFNTAEFLWAKPVSIAQISFEQKTLLENNVLMVGDAAGMITPLCGNGMSMAMHGAKIAFEFGQQFLNEEISREELIKMYEKRWQQLFAKRLQTGRIIQGFFGNETMSNLLVSSMKLIPFLAQPLIKLTHGRPF